MDHFEFAYVAFVIAILTVAALVAIVRWVIGAICRAEIRKFFKGHVITRRGRNGRFVGLR